MVKLTTNSPLSRRIVFSFLDFLNFVEPASDVDREGIELAKEFLSEAFKLESLSVKRTAKSDSLVDIFSSLEASEHHENKSDVNHEENSSVLPSISSAHTDSKIAEKDWVKETDNLGIRDELFGQYFGALERIHYFGTSPDEDQVQLDRATSLFHNALMEMEKSGCETFDQKNLAETFKVQGNKAMQSKLYPDAIEFYSIAIALHEDNAVYYCNRAAAYTQIKQYAEAIKDCYKSIEIDPNYSKAYSRLGFVYYAQGNYRDSIGKGFMRALQLDPNNNSIKENIRAAEQKLREQLRAGHNQNTSSASHSDQHAGGGSRSQGSSPLPFNVDITSILRNMTPNVEQHFQQATTGVNGSTTEPNLSSASHSDQHTGGGSRSQSTPMPFNVDIGSILRNMTGGVEQQFQQATGVNANTTEPNPSSASHSDQHTGGESRSQGMPMPFNVDIASILRNMTPNANNHGGVEQQFQQGTGVNGNTREPVIIREVNGVADINLDGGIENISEVLRSAVHMFSGSEGAPSSNGGPPDNLNGRSAPS